MSLILDALKKAERERNRETYGTGIPGLSTEPLPSPSVMTPPLPTWALVTVLLLLALMVLGFWVWVLRKPADEPLGVVVAASVAAAPVSADAATSSATASFQEPSLAISDVAAPGSRAASLVARPLVERPSVDWAERIDGLYLQLNAPAPRLARPAPAKIDVPAQPASKPNKVAEAAASVVTPKNPVANALSDGALPDDVRPDDAQPDEDLRALWQSVREADASPAEPPAPLIDSGRVVPYLHQLPESFQSHIPTLMYTNHIYSAEKGGAVILNDKSYREGDTLAPDLVIERITETDLLLRYRGKPFRLAALSSWVTGKPR